MKKKAKQTRDEQVYHARMKKQIELYGFYQGKFLPGTELDDGLDSDPKIETVIKRVLREIAKGSPLPVAVRIIKKQVTQAVNGDRKAAEFLFDRAYGKPQQSIKVDAPAAVNITHTVINIEEAKNLQK
jgi:hypothetical protein